MPERDPGRVALYGAGGSPYHHAAILAAAGHHVEFVFPVDVRSGALAGFDVFVMPGGGYRAMLGQLEPLGTEGARAIRDFVAAGGMYIGCCAGSYDAAIAAPSFLEACPAQGEMCLLPARVWNHSDTEWLGLQSPGIGVLRAETVAPEHPVMAGMPRTFEIAHYNGPLFLGAEPLARVVGATDRFTPAERALAAPDGPALIDGAAEAGAANVVAGPHGDGRVVLFGSHPEFGFGIAMEDAQAPARMLLNAVAWQLAESGRPERPAVELWTDREPDPDADAARVQDLADALHERTAAMRERGDAVAWLRPDRAMSFFGLEPREIWRQSLDAIDRLAGEAAARAPQVEPRVLGFRPPGEWEVDGGYQGVVALLEQSVELIDRALEAWDDDLGVPATPYEQMLTSPYHHVAGSYLAAVGRVTGAALLCTAFARVAV
jgi:hypothetical protein